VNYSRIDRISASKAIKRILPGIEVLSSTQEEAIVFMISDFMSEDYEQTEIASKHDITGIRV
jgi:hypothetical protein